MNAQIYQLWQNGPRDLRGERVPKFVCPQPVGGILYLSLNPSFPTPLPAWILNQPFGNVGFFTADHFQWDEFVDFAPVGFHTWKAEAHARIHELAKAHYRWFRRLNQLAGFVRKNDYALVDLFLRLDAQLMNLPPAYRNAANWEYSENPNFIQRQLDFAFEQTIAARPKVIIAVYAAAADIFHRYFGTRFPNANLQPFVPVPGVNGLQITSLPAVAGWSDSAVPFLRCSALPNPQWMPQADFEGICGYVGQL